MICSQIESANMGDLNYRGVIPNVHCRKIFLNRAILTMLLISMKKFYVKTSSKLLKINILISRENRHTGSAAQI